MQERVALLRQTSMRDPAGRGRRDTGRSDYGPLQVNADGWSTLTTRLPTKAGDLTKFGKIDRSAGLQFGPSSLFSKRGDKRESASVTRVSSSSSMFAMLNSSEATPDAVSVEYRTAASTPSRKAGIDMNSGTIHMEREEANKRRLDEERRKEDLAKVKAKRDADAAERRRRDDEEKERRKRDEERERKKDEEEHRKREDEEEKRRAEERRLEEERLEKESLEKERLEKERLEKERPEKRLEQIRLAKERLAKDIADRKERAQRLSSAVVRARFIEDIDKVSYPQGIKAPRRELNVNAASGKFR